MNTEQQQTASSESSYDYSNAGWPRDFDIRIEVAEQKEIAEQSRTTFTQGQWHCSEYDF